MHEWNRIKINIKRFEHKSIKVEVGPWQTPNHIHLKFMEWIPCQRLIAMTNYMLIIWLIFILRSKEMPMASKIKNKCLNWLIWGMKWMYHIRISFSSVLLINIHFTKPFLLEEWGPCLWGICYISKVQNTRAMSTFSYFPPTITSQKPFSDFK
jgi:hypothetical protein